MIKVLLFILFLPLIIFAQTPPGNHVILNGSTQYLSFTTPTPPPTRTLREVSSRMLSARIGHATDQVLFDWTGVGTLYIRAVSAGTTNLEFVPASGTGTTTVNITPFTTGFIYRFRYDDIGPNMAYILEAWDSRGDQKTVVSSIVTASAATIDPNNRAVTIGAKLDGTLHLQANIDYWRWHEQWIPLFPVAGKLGGQSPAPTFTKPWLACNLINGNENWIDFQFENDLSNSGQITVTLTGTGSPTFGASSNTQPTATGEDLTGVAKGRIPLNGTMSYDYDSTGKVTTDLLDTLSSNWTCISAPGAGCGALTIRQNSKLFTWVDGATAIGTYTFTFGVSDGSLTDTDTVTVDVVNVAASIGDTSCFTNEPCLLDGSASTGWDSIKVDTGETIPDSALKYTMNIARSVHRYHTAGNYTATVTAYDAQSSPTNSVDTATITVTNRAEADGSNTEDLTNAGNANHISVANCTGDATGNRTKVQNAVDIAKARNTVAQKIILPKGCRADGVVTLKNPVGNGLITIISSGTLPANHKRITLSDTAEMFTMRATVANDSAVTTETSAHHYKLRGIIFEAASNQFAVLNLGQPSTEDETTEIAHTFIIQHSIIRPTNEFSINIQNGIMNNANNVSFIDNYITPMSFAGIESHNYLGYASEGKHVINNNYMGGASINLFIGGAPTIVRGIVAKDIEIRENHIWKPLEWETSHPSWDGKVRGVKNLFELKTGSNLVSTGNVAENNWTDAQAGRGVLLQATCDSGNWATAENIDYSYNVLNNSERGYNVRGTEYKGILQSRKLWLTHNLVEGLDSQPLVLTQTNGVRINHMTFTAQTDKSASFDGEFRSSAFVYENSITYEGTYGWFGDSIGLPSLNKYTPGFIFRDSLQVGGSLANYGSPVSGMQFPTDETAVGFTNPAGRIWSLSAGSNYKNDANDGTDPGVNWADLQSNIKNTVSGDWTGAVVIRKCNWHANPRCNQ